LDQHISQEFVISFLPRLLIPHHEPDHHQSLTVPPKNSLKLVDKFLTYPADRQTDIHTQREMHNLLGGGKTRPSLGHEKLLMPKSWELGSVNWCDRFDMLSIVLWPAFNIGDINQLLYPKDSEGNYCGVDKFR